MEFLKGFSFDIQRFAITASSAALTDLESVATAASGGLWLDDDGNGTYTIVAAEGSTAGHTYTKIGTYTKSGTAWTLNAESTSPLVTFDATSATGTWTISDASTNATAITGTGAVAVTAKGQANKSLVVTANSTELTSGTWTAIANNATINTKTSVVSEVTNNGFTIIPATNGGSATAVYNAGGNKLDDVDNATLTIPATATNLTTIEAEDGATPTVIVSSASDRTLTVNNDGSFVLTGGSYNAAASTFGTGAVSVKATTAVVVDGTTYAVKAEGVIENTTAITVTAGSAAHAATSTVAQITAGNRVYTGLAAAGGAADATFSSDGSVTNLTAGTLTESTAASISVNDKTFTKKTAATALTVGYYSGDTEKVAVVDGEIVQSSGKAYGISASDTLADMVEVSGGSVEITFATGAATVDDLDKGETIVITSGGNKSTYEAVSTDIVKKTDNTGVVTYYTGLTKAAQFTYAGTTLAATTGDDITVKNVDTTTYYSALGVGGLSADSDDVAASVTVSSGSKTVDVKDTFSKKIILTDAPNVTVTKDAKGTTVFQTKDGTFTVAEGKGFKSTDSVISDAGGTITTVTGFVTASGSVSVDASGITPAATTLVKYVAGTGLSDTSVKYITSTGTPVVNTVKITESTNTNETVVAHDGTDNVRVSGLDDGATITGATTGDIYTTAASGTFTFNGKAWTLAEDDDGAAFTVNTAAAGQISKIDSLVKEAKVSTTSKLTGENIQVGTRTFTSVNAKSGATFTSLANSGDATITLSTAKDSVVIGTNTYEVESMGGAADGIVIGNDTLAALNDGDKIKVYATATPTVYREYEVSGNTMVMTYNNAGAVTTTSYTLSDSSDPGFTVGSAIAGTTINGDTGTTVDVKFGTSATAATNQATASITDGLYVNADGTVTTSDKNALAKVNKADDLVTYVSSSSKGQEVSVSSSANNSDNWSITTGAGKDLITFAANTDASIDAGAGDDTIIVNGRGSKVVSTGDGKNTVSLNGSGDINLTLGAGKDEVTDLGTTGDVVVTANGGNNDINMAAATGDVTITGGSGNDTIKAASTDNVVSGGGGKDVFDITTTSVKVSDYTFGDDVIQVAAGTTLAPAMLTGDGTVSVAAGQVADISANAGDFYAADIKIGTNKALHTAWAKEGGSNINTTAFSNDALVKGDADGVNTLYTGAGDDVIYSYADNDSVYGGEGKDSITLQANGTGRVVGIATNSSKDTVSGFTAGFSDSDSIFMVDGDVSGVKTTLESVSGGTGKFTFKDGAASLTLGSVGVNTVTGAAEVLVNGFKLAALAAGATAKVDDASYADIYMGDKSTVDFSAVDGDLFVDLSNGLAGSSAGAKYVGVNAVTGGNGNSTLMGTGSADYIVATSGKTSLFGGAGKDTLVGNSNSADVFFFGDGTGSNTINNFTTQGNDNADTLQVYSNITGAKLNGSNVEISTADGSKAILTSQNANSKINVASTGFTGVAKVGSASSANNFNYDNDVTYYGGGSASDKIAFSSGYAENAQVWLDGSQGKSYASIDVVDGTNAGGSLIVAGDSASQSIIGGKGDTSLWGGAGSATDTLRSSASGKTMFWWGAGDGNDVVVSASADDSVNLYNVKLSDINSANSSITNSGVVLALNDGSKLTMQTTRNMTFSIEGQSWTADQSSKEWKQNS